MNPKLVRDNIPDIIADEGRIPHIKILTDIEYHKQLNKKLLEEVQEYLENNDVEELADILEVIYAISREKNFSPNDLELIREKKKRERGGFEKKILLCDVTVPE